MSLPAVSSFQNGSIMQSFTSIRSAALLQLNVIQEKKKKEDFTDKVQNALLLPNYSRHTFVQT